MPERIVVVGAGGFGRETLDVIEAVIGAGAAIELVGVVDSGPSEVDLERLAQRGVRYLGTEDDWATERAGDERLAVAIGAPRIRRAVATRWSERGVAAASPLVHPRAVLGTRVSLSEGVIVASGVQVSTNVSLGRHVHLNPGAIIGHDSALHDIVSVNPGAIVSGAVVVEEGVLLGAGSTVLQGLRIGAHSVVGAAACVTRDVITGQTVVGVPARTKEDI